MFLRNLTIGVRLPLAFVLLIATCLGLAGLGAVRLQQVFALGDNALDEEVAKLQAASRIESSARTIHALSLESYLAATPQQRANLRSAVDSNQLKIAQSIAALTPLAREDREQIMLVQLVGSTETFQTTVDQSLSQSASARTDESSAEAGRQAISDALVTVADRVAAWVAHETHRIAAVRAAMRTRYLGALSFLAAGGLAALLLGGLLAWSMTRGIVQPLRALQQRAMAVANGELSESRADAGKDELGDARRAMLAVVESLRRISEAQHEMFSNHEAGNSDFRIPAGQFRGVYSRMAEGVNLLAAAQIHSASRRAADAAAGDIGGPAGGEAIPRPEARADLAVDESLIDQSATTTANIVAAVKPVREVRGSMAPASRSHGVDGVRGTTMAAQPDDASGHNAPRAAEPADRRRVKPMR